MHSPKGYWIIECQKITDQIYMEKYANSCTEIANELNAQIIGGTKSSAL